MVTHTSRTGLSVGEGRSVHVRVDALVRAFRFRIDRRAMLILISHSGVGGTARVEGDEGDGSEE